MSLPIFVKFKADENSFHVLRIDLIRGVHIDTDNDKFQSVIPIDAPGGVAECYSVEKPEKILEEIERAKRIASRNHNKFDIDDVR